MATHWVVLVAATLLSCSPELGHGNPTDPLELEPVFVTPSPPLGPVLSQSIEKASPAAVPYVAEAIEEALVPTYLPLVPVEAPCQKPAPLPAPLSFALPTPTFQSPIYSFLSQAQNADPALALNAVSKVLASALPPHFQLAASVPASPPAAAPCAAAAAPATTITYLPPSPPTPLADTQTLLNLGLLQPTAANLPLQQHTVIPLDANSLLNFASLQPSPASYPADPSALTLAALQPANLGLTQLTPELLAQLTLSAVPAGTPCNTAAPQTTYLPSAVSPQLTQSSFTLPLASNVIATAPAPASAASPATLEALSEIENSKIGLVKNAWSKLYDPLRRLRTHSHLG